VPSKALLFSIYLFDPVAFPAVVLRNETTFCISERTENAKLGFVGAAEMATVADLGGANG
jgi:hypothetical protein